MVCWSVLVVLLGCFLTVAGTYGSIFGIVDSYKESGDRLPFLALITPTLPELRYIDQR